ncbi:MAG TPA: hypothetical protein VGQ36_28395 [Thermoanaerobaculia bacterium]|jgi:hypothetical protein|nr:hypothetical protein [Thermoanaerobaculia bacterium]
MRRTFILVALTLLAPQLFASEGPRQLRDRVEPGAGMQWVKKADFSAVSLAKAELEANLAEVNGARPIVLLETNYYTYVANDPLELRLTVNPNGYGGPVTIYLYREDRNTGDRRYHSVSGELAAGVQADLFGSAGSPVPVFVPTLNDFVLFGSGASTSALSWKVNGALGQAITVPASETALRQFVVELRDAAGKRVLARSNAMYSYVTGSVDVTGKIQTNTTWTADKRYILHDYVGVVGPAVLTIQPGTVIYGGDGRATLFIQRGAKIIADGTSRRPIIFTSPQKVGDRAQKDWGSLVILGNAPINQTTAIMEGLSSFPEYTYGGADPADNSGVLRYVRLEFGGFEIATAQEINGLTLGGVGTGTVVDYVEVLHNKDDAFEFFGGTVNASHLLGVAFADDGIDVDFGYSGSIQFAAMIKRAANDEGDANFLGESDNDADGSTKTPLTNPKVYNVTAVRQTSDTGFYGARIRRNSGGHWHNVVVAGSKNAPIFIDGGTTQNNAASGVLVFDHSLLFGDFSDAKYPNVNGAPSRTHLFTTWKNNRNADPLLAIGTPTLLKTYMPDLTPLPGSPALDANFVGNPPDNGFLVPVDYQGAVGPGDNWLLTGWASFSDN